MTEPAYNRRARKRRGPWLPESLKMAIIVVTVVILLTMAGVIVWAALMPIPSINSFENRQVAQSTKIYDRTGNVLLYDVHGTEQRTSVPLDKISPYVQDATIAVEDRTFYSNIGIDPYSIVRAFLADITHGGYAQGASTITQQVVRNALLTSGKTIPRKIEEVILAIRLTRAYSKQDILNTYLNEAPYGGPVYGVEAASQYYFGVDASNVDLAQSAYLAALPQAPTFYSPYGANKSALDARKNLVLKDMLDQGYITQDQYNQAKNEVVQFKAETASGGILAPHFVMYILQELEQKYGADTVENGGLRVTTTLDYDLQQHMQQAVDNHSAEMAKDFNASNEAMTAIDPKTGQILAMVGSRDFFDNSIEGQYNDALALRQPGSTFKMFTYATALEKGYTPDTVLFDLPTQFSTACQPSDNTNNTPPCYSPVNYNGQFKGPMTLRDAISQSENIPSVKVIYLDGIAAAVKTAQDLGITTLTASNYGLPLGLGDAQVNLLEMTGAYSVFANDGVRNPPTGILEVADQSGNVLESYQPQPQQVLDPQIAREMNDILSDDTARAPDFGVHGVLWFQGADVADKTGTTDSSRDAWVIGYTPSIAVGAWAGNNDNSPMVKKIAAFIVSPMWHEFMAYAIQKYPAQPFTPPAPNPNIASLPPVLTGNWNTNPGGGVHDILYWINKDNPTVLAPGNPSGDPQEAYWDYPVQQWAAGQNFSASSTPTSYPDNTSTASVFSIVTPAAGTVVSGSSAITFTAEVPNASAVSSVEYFLNGKSIGSASTPPYTVTHLPQTRGPSSLKAIEHLDDGSTQSVSETFTIQ